LNMFVYNNVLRKLHKIKIRKAGFKIVNNKY